VSCRTCGQPGCTSDDQDAAGTWSLTLDNVAPDLDEYHFKVDD
jgi:hypothetical protein